MSLRFLAPLAALAVVVVSVFALGVQALYLHSAGSTFVDVNGHAMSHQRPVGSEIVLDAAATAATTCGAKESDWTGDNLAAVWKGTFPINGPDGGSFPFSVAFAADLPLTTIDDGAPLGMTASPAIFGVTFTGEALQWDAKSSYLTSRGGPYTILLRLHDPECATGSGTVQKALLTAQPLQGGGYSPTGTATPTLEL